MKRQTYLRDENLLTLLSLHDFIVPEIQREYVWGSKDNADNILKAFLESIRDSAQVDVCCHHAHGLENLHIGFLYSYKPQYIRDISERITDEYLIDGQQRFTSLFFLLLVRAVVEDRLTDFNNLIRWEDDNIAFDYKVRQLTHSFIMDFIAHVQKDGKQVLEDIVKGNYPFWLMNDYLCDTTVKNIIGAIRCIQEVFDKEDDLYYDYLLIRIHFWHFKTDVTSQGEELYITMNSRGEQLSDNEVQKARRLKNTQQSMSIWGPKWEEWQTFFWRNRNQANADNYDADKGFNNLLACVDAMGVSFEEDYSSIESTETTVEAFRFIVETDWKSILQMISSVYYTDWIELFKKDVWDRINKTNAKWNIEKDSDTVQMENAVLLWPLFYYYFKQKGNKQNIITFVRLMHLCYLNYHSKKTNYTAIKDFIGDLCAAGSNMLALNSVNNKKFLSDENIELSELIAKSKTPEKLESLIWQVQDKEYFLDGEDVGGNTIIDYVKSINANNVDLCDGLENLRDNYDVLFPPSSSASNEILLKRILLHYKNSDGKTFWSRKSPYYDRNYETSSWKRIVRHGAFRNFYIEITNGYKKQIIQNDLMVLLGSKLNSFFGNPTNRDFTKKKWSDRRIAILVDTVTKDGLWKNGIKLKDLGFSEDNALMGKPFIGNTWIGNRICGKRYKWQKVLFPSGWEQKLQKLYPLYTFIF